MTEDCPHYSIQMQCRECDLPWAAVMPVTGDDCFALECPKCGEKNWVATPSPPVHLIISQMNGALWVKPNRAVPRWKMIAMLSEALAMANDSAEGVILPENCQLEAFLTVNDSQVPDRG